MDQCTHEVRAQHWKEIILACQQRPDGQSAKQWLKENGILEQSYYKWQQKFRKETFELMQAAAVIKTSSMTITISNEISESLLTQIIREVSANA